MEISDAVAAQMRELWAWYKATKGKGVQLRRRTVNYGGDGGGDRRAFVKATPTTGAFLEVYLDTDLTGEEVVVECDIYDDDGAGGSFAADVWPVLAVGTPIWVQQISETWHNKTPIHQAGPC